MRFFDVLDFQHLILAFFLGAASFLIIWRPILEQG